MAGLQHDEERRKQPPRWLDAAIGQIRGALSRAERSLEGLQRTPEQAAPAPAEEAKPKQWHAIIKMTELGETGGKGVVLRSFDDLEEAKGYRDRHKQVALYPWPFEKEPPRSMVVEVQTREVEALNRDGRGLDLARQFRVLGWKAEQGAYHAFGLWNEREEEPRKGQLVNFTTGIDYRGEPVGRLVGPLRSVNPGEPEKTRPVVFEMSRKTPGLGRIVELPATVEEAPAAVKRLDERRLDQEQAASRFQTLEVGSGLRELARELVPQAPPLKVTTHELGNRKVEVIDRVGEHGTRQRSYIVSREVAEADGRVRTISTVLDSEDIRAIDGARKALRMERAQAREASQQKAQEQAPEAKAEAKEAERPVPAVPPLEERKAQEPTRAPASAEVPYQDHPRWVLGIWWGEAPPRFEEAIRYEPGQPRLEDRAMTPVYGHANPGGPAERPRYVLAEIIDAKQGLAVVRASTRDRDHAEYQAAKFQRDSDLGREVQAEHVKAREVRQEQGLSMGL